MLPFMLPTTMLPPIMLSLPARFRRHAPAIAGLILFLATAAVAAAESVLEVIPLRHRPAEQLIPVLQPLVGRDSSISGLHNQLVVRATAAELAQLRRVVAELDTPPRRLQISVRQIPGGGDQRSEAGLVPGAGGSEARGSRPGAGDEGARARLVESNQAGQARVVQTVQVLEGHSAVIQVGESRPVPPQPAVRTVINGQVVDRVPEATQYREVSTGFSVLPRLQGDRVTLDIDPRREQFDPDRRGGIRQQRLVTTVSGRIGEWIDLGGVREDRGDSRSEVIGTRSLRLRDPRAVQVRVDLLP